MAQHKQSADPCGHGPTQDGAADRPGLFAHLDPPERARLQALAHSRRFARGATVLAEGEEGSFVGSVVEGVLKMQKTQPDGRQQIVGLLVPNDMFGRVFAGRSDFAIEAATDVTLCCFDKKRFEAMLLDHPQIEHQVMLRILDELDAARDWITLLGAQTVAQKFASFLLMLCRRWPSLGCGLSKDARHVEVSVPIGRADLAQYLGTTVETISRTVGALVRAGLIESVTPTRFVVRDLNGLIAASGSEEFDAGTILAHARAGTGSG